MIVISDNTAFNILLTMVGMDKTNNTLKKLGLVDTNVRCLLFEWNKLNPERDNFHSVREIGSLLKRLYKRQLISTSASDSMLKLLSYHQRRNIMLFFTTQKISVAHQTGFDSNALHEAAIILTKKPFVLCMSTNQVDAKIAEQAMKDVARICYESAME